MTINISSMIIALSRKIQTATSSDDILTLSKAVELLQSGAVFTVPTVANLPVGDSARSAQLVLVVADQQLYVYRQSNNQWIPIVNTATTPMLSWGRNGFGQLGDGSIITQPIPVSVVDGFADWSQISAGGSHSLAIRANGTAWAWGCGGQGGLGDGTGISRLSPVSVVGGFTDWCVISAGNDHSLAIRTNGTAWAWGRNFLFSCGKLGDGTTADRFCPVAVVGGFADWCAIAAGRYHSAAVRTNGTAWSWGRNTYGQLGDGTVTHRSSPGSVTGGFSDWCAISAGDGHSLAMRTNSTLWSWGLNNSVFNCGQLGDGTSTDRSSPVAVVGGFTDWCAISAGSSHNLAIRSNGTAWAWGRNFRGKLGTGGGDQSSPASVLLGFTDWCAVAAGSNHSAAIRANGTLWSWGYNNCGQVGDGTTSDRYSPVSVAGGIADWSAVAAGGDFSLGLRTQPL